MNRPNKLDWIIYSVFRKWWNPIFNENKKIGEAFIKMSSIKLEYEKGKISYIPNEFWWNK